MNLIESGKNAVAVAAVGVGLLAGTSLSAHHSGEMFEAEGPQDLMHGGVRKSDLPPGARITVTARPMRDGRPAGIWSTIVKEDGTLLNWRTPGPD